MSYTGLFLNMILCKVNNFNTQISVTLRKKNYSVPNDNIEMKITKINTDKKFDSDIFPELNSL